MEGAGEGGWPNGRVGGEAVWQVLAGAMSGEHTGRPAGGPRGTVLCLDVKRWRSTRLTHGRPCRSLPAWGEQHNSPQQAASNRKPLSRD